MQLIAVGLNHKTAPVEIRERFSIPKERVRGGLIALSGYAAVNEAVKQAEAANEALMSQLNGFGLGGLPF